MMQTQKTQLPKKFWLYSKKRYFLKGVQSLELPFVDLEYERILKSNGIPYRKVIRDVYDNFITNKPKEVCEYWDPNFGLKEEEFSLPLFAQVGTTYKYCEKNYTEKVPTLESIQKAIETAYFVQDKIDEYDEIMKQVELYRLLKEQLSGKTSKMWNVSAFDFPQSLRDGIHMNHDDFKLIMLSYSWVGIFDMNKIVPNECLYLEVPKHIAGLVIGKGGANIKNWAKELGVKRIQVIPI